MMSIALAQVPSMDCKIYLRDTHHTKFKRKLDSFLFDSLHNMLCDWTGNIKLSTSRLFSRSIIFLVDDCYNLSLYVLLISVFVKKDHK